MEREITTRIILEITGSAVPPAITVWDGGAKVIELLNWARQEDVASEVTVYSVHQDKKFI